MEAALRELVSTVNRTQQNQSQATFREVQKRQMDKAAQFAVMVGDRQAASVLPRAKGPSNPF
ncbi:hypothetical protein [Ralstonia thomasii]|jgi:hypothetical protein